MGRPRTEPALRRSGVHLAISYPENEPPISSGAEAKVPSTAFLRPLGDRLVGSYRRASPSGEELVGELPEGLLRLSQGAAAGRGGPIGASSMAVDDPAVGGQEPFLLHAVERRVEGSRGDAVAVAGELRGHPGAVDVVSGGVMEDVQPDGSTQKLLHTGQDSQPTDIGY